jgi:hypothetical protein
LIIIRSIAAGGACGEPDAIAGTINSRVVAKNIDNRTFAYINGPRRGNGVSARVNDLYTNNNRLETLIDTILCRC